MRILGYLEHPIMKITVFSMNNRVSIKFESGLYEQTYKFREAEVDTLGQVEQLVDADFLVHVEKTLQGMHLAKMAALSRNLPQEELHWEEII